MADYLAPNPLPKELPPGTRYWQRGDIMASDLPDGAVLVPGLDRYVTPGGDYIPAHRIDWESVATASTSSPSTR